MLEKSANFVLGIDRLTESETETRFTYIIQWLNNPL